MKVILEIRSQTHRCTDTAFNVISNFVCTIVPVKGVDYATTDTTMQIKHYYYYH